MKAHRKGLYTALLLERKLTAHLNEVDKEWIAAMNHIRNVAEEIVVRKLVYG